mmetsp:Transcript_2655/g.5124  ORF Transcript_2655/g.5124 Transcript_2655/m.5124 type:complete len:217 (-) Transcript_2655:470-1120(-)
MAFASSLLYARVHALTDLLVGAEEHRRVDVALDEALLAENVARVRHVDRPVERDNVALHVALQVEVAAAAVCVVDHRHLRVARAHVCHRAICVGLGEGGELRRAKVVCPRLEELDHLRPALDLVARILPNGVGQTAERGVQHLRVAHHHLLGVDAVAIGLPLYSVRHQREGRADEAEQRVAPLRLRAQVAQNGADEWQFAFRVVHGRHGSDVGHGA